MPLGRISNLNPVNRRHPLNRGRISWWLTLPHLYGGRQWFDLMGQNRFALTNMTTSASGWRGTTRPGGAGHVLSDGVNDNLTLVNSNLPVGASSRTIAGWVYLNAYSATISVLFNYGNNSLSGGVFCIEIAGTSAYDGSPTGRLMFETWGSTTHSTLGVSVGQWTRWALSFTSQSVARFYINGIDAGAVSSSQVVATVAGTTAYIGSFPLAFSAPNDTINGAIDDVSIWNRALSAREVWQDYDLSRRGYPGVLNRVDDPFWARQASGLLLARRRAMLGAI